MTNQPQEKTRITLAEFMQLPESPLKTEFIHGELITYGSEGKSPAAKDMHEEIISILFAYLCQFVPPRELRVSRTDVHIDGENVVQPDILWASAESGRCVRRADGYLHGPPDLVIEVLSPATAARDRGVKFALYQQSGVREYWLVDYEATYVEVYVLSSEGRFARQGAFGLKERFTSAVLGAKDLSVKAIFGLTA